MSKYDPTVNPGDHRTRTRYIGIRTENLQTPRVQVLEEVVALVGGKEVTIDASGEISASIDGAELARVVEIRDPLDDSLTGQTLTVAEIYAGVYSWVRTHQELRDAQEASNEPEAS